MNVDVVVVGGCASGLTVARGLVEQGFSVGLLEARDRLGGRIATTQRHNSNVPLELGAEFVHGMPPEIFSLPAADFPLYEVGGETWRFRHGRLHRGRGMDRSLEEMLSEIAAWQGADRSLASFLDERFPDGRHAARRRLEGYFEGFDAADPGTVSIKWLALTEQAAGIITGDRQFRLSSGYGSLISWLRSSLPTERAQVRLNTIVREVEWSPGQVQIRSHDPAGTPLEPVTARAAVITLPLGVLSAGPDEDGAVRFVPALPEKQRACASLAMGQVLKVVLRFREPFWEHRQQPYPHLPRLSFLFAPNETFPTWWTSYPLIAPQLTGWVAGPRAVPLARQSDTRIIGDAVSSLARILDVPAHDMEAALASTHLHNWSTDPFARGAYSYVRAGGIEAPRQLGTPLAATLFFAGEATDAGGQTGTVHGAMASGNRVVCEILKGGS